MNEPATKGDLIFWSAIILASVSTNKETQILFTVMACAVWVYTWFTKETK